MLRADSALSAAVTSHGMLQGLVPSLADDAFYLQPQQPLAEGPDDVRALFAARASSAELRFNWRAVRADVSDDGLLAYSFGYGRYIPAGADGTPSSGRGGYLIVWRRPTRNADWQVAAFVRNNAQGDIPAAPQGFGTPVDSMRTSAHDRRTPSVADLRAEVIATDLAFSAMAGSSGVADAFAAFAAPDGALLVGAFGPAEIRSSFAGAPAGTGSWRPVHAEVSGSGDLAFTVGTAELRTAGSAAGEPARVSYTKYVSVWRRQPDGTWRYVVDGGNGSPRP